MIRLVIAGGVVTLCSVLALVPETNPVEVAIFRELGFIPQPSTPLWVGLTWVGSWAGVSVAAALAMYLKRIRLGLQCAAAGAATWALTRLMHWVVGTRPAPPPLLSQAAMRLPGEAVFWFPASHVAVAAALAGVATPYLSHRTRNLAWAVTALVGVADVYLGHHLPLGAFAGAFLGWGVGTLFHLVWGAPGRQTSEAAVYRALDLAGLAPVHVARVKRRRLGPLKYAVDTESGDTLRVEIVRRRHRRAGPWYKLRRLLASLDVQDEPRLSTTHHEAEHEAYVTLFAERAGLRTPPILLACEVQHGWPLLVRQQVEGRRLPQLRPDEIDDALLDAVWEQLRILSGARIAHHDLRAKNILIDTQRRPWLLDFTFGRVGASPERSAQDVAEVLVSLAPLVGVERAVTTACRALPADQLEAALAYLQPLALPRRIRDQADGGRYVITDLRETLADRIDRPIPAFRSPVRPVTLATLLLGGGAVYLLLPQLSSVAAVAGSLREANWGWLAAAFIAGLLAIVMSAVSVLGSSHVTLPFWRTTAVQVAAAFTGRTTPGGVGFFGINIAYLERLGVRRSLAVGVPVLNVTGTGVVAGVASVVGILGVGILGAGASGMFREVSIPTGWPALVAMGGVLVIVGVVVGVIVGSPFGRRRVVRPSLQAARELLVTLHHPVRATQLCGGALGYLLFMGLGLAASLAAFQPEVPLLAVLAVFVVGQTLGHLAPTPGGLGAVEAVLVAGLIAVGIPLTASVAAVLTMRLLTYWLPVLPGIAMFRYLQHHNVV